MILDQLWALILRNQPPGWPWGRSLPVPEQSLPPLPLQQQTLGMGRLRVLGVVSLKEPRPIDQGSPRLGQGSGDPHPFQGVWGPPDLGSSAQLYCPSQLFFMSKAPSLGPHEGSAWIEISKRRYR